MEAKQLINSLPAYEKHLLAQEKRRRRLGAKEVAQPTYQRYITGPVARFDRNKNIFALFNRENAYGQEIKERIQDAYRGGFAARFAI